MPWASCPGSTLNCLQNPGKGQENSDNSAVGGASSDSSHCLKPSVVCDLKFPLWSSPCWPLLPLLALYFIFHQFQAIWWPHSPQTNPCFFLSLCFRLYSFWLKWLLPSKSWSSPAALPLPPVLLLRTSAGVISKESSPELDQSSLVSIGGCT